MVIFLSSTENYSLYTMISTSKHFNYQCLVYYDNKMRFFSHSIIGGDKLLKFTICFLEIITTTRQLITNQSFCRVGRRLYYWEHIFQERFISVSIFLADDTGLMTQYRSASRRQLLCLVCFHWLLYFLFPHFF